MKRNTYLSLFLGLGCTALAFGLISNAFSPAPKAPIPIVYMDAQVQYLQDMIKKGEYYKVDSNLITEAIKIDLNNKLVSKASNAIFNQLEDQISEAEDKLRLNIYYKNHTPEQNAQAKALFEKAWSLNSQMHQAIKNKDNQLVLEIQSQFGELETPIAAEIMKIAIPEIKLK
jgi:predicted HNH restriction endonuclease